MCHRIDRSVGVLVRLAQSRGSDDDPDGGERHRRFVQGSRRAPCRSLPATGKAGSQDVAVMLFIRWAFLIVLSKELLSTLATWLAICASGQHPR